MGALIVVRQEGNRVGWLMMAGALTFALPFSFLVTFYPEPPDILTPGLWLLLWVHSWFFILGIIAIFMIVLHFPDGRPPSGGWNWMNKVAIAAILLIVLLLMFSEQIGPTTGEWSVDNPLGFLPPTLLQGINILTAIGFVITAGGSLTSLFVRFRRGGFLERQQIKWLFFAGAIFIVAVGLLLNYWSTSPSASNVSWQDLLFLISVLAFPFAIGNAILRYRLYEIDIIIRRTLQYGIVTGLLAMVYFGLVITLQTLFAAVGDIQSEIIIVISTLAIAGLFTPVRRRVQAAVDRRFYRRKYDAEQALARFAAAARDEVDLERLAAALMEVIEETIQPEHTSLSLMTRE